MLFKNSDKEDRIVVKKNAITTFIGSDTVIEGALKTKSSIRIDGTIRGDIESEGIIVVTSGGRIEGDVKAANIIVAGVVAGDMSIEDKVNVEPGGEVYGDVITRKFVIDEESIFQGNCVMNRDGKVNPDVLLRKRLKTKSMNVEVIDEEDKAKDKAIKPEGDKGAGEDKKGEAGDKDKDNDKDKPEDGKAADKPERGEVKRTRTDDRPDSAKDKDKETGSDKKMPDKPVIVKGNEIKPDEDDDELEFEDLNGKRRKRRK